MVTASRKPPGLDQHRQPVVWGEVGPQGEKLGQLSIRYIFGAERSAGGSAPQAIISGGLL